MDNKSIPQAGAEIKHMLKILPGRKPTGPTPVVVALADVEPESIDWLWKPYLPAAKLTILEGDPGVGKTWVALAICAELTARGRAVLYATAEDGVADTLRVRVNEMGADLSKFFILQGQEKGGLVVPVTLAQPGPLRAAVLEYRPALVVLDPVQGFLGGDIDMHRANETRPRLAYLTRLAEEIGCGVLIIRHLSKSSAGRAIYRGLGSIDFAAAARSVLLAGQTGTGERAVAHIKNSLCETGATLGFRVQAGRFLWTGEADVDAGDLLRGDDAAEDKTALDEAVDFLTAALAVGRMSTKELQKEAGAAGIAKRTLWRAKARLGIKTRRTADGWEWFTTQSNNN